MPANEKRRYVMMSDFRQYIAEYTIANFWHYPIRRHVTYASALEVWLDSYFWPFLIELYTQNMLIYLDFNMNLGIA